MCDAVRISRVLLKTLPLHPGISQETPLVGTSKVAPLVGYHHSTKANQSTVTVAIVMMLPLNHQSAKLMSVTTSLEVFHT